MRDFILCASAYFHDKNFRASSLSSLSLTPPKLVSIQIIISAYSHFISFSSMFWFVCFADTTTVTLINLNNHTEEHEVLRMCNWTDAGGAAWLEPEYDECSTQMSTDEALKDLSVIVSQRIIFDTNLLLKFIIIL